MLVLVDTLIFPDSAWDTNLPKSHYFELVQVGNIIVLYHIPKKIKIWGKINSIGGANIPAYYY